MEGHKSHQIPMSGADPDNFISSSQSGMSGSLSREAIFGSL